MNKTLKEFTKEDWDTLFPITLVDHDPSWKKIYDIEEKRIRENTTSKFTKRIEHFGSSSIPNIKSKPYIDILIEVPQQFLFNQVFVDQLESIGYTCLTQPNAQDENNYMILVKGYKPDGTSDQIFHLHACPSGHPMMKQLEFKEYLIAHPLRAAEYERLKILLEIEFKNNRSSYRIAKTEFINETLAMVK